MRATKENRRSALQDWVMGLTVMQQSVLMAAVRGPDGAAKDHPAKHLVRWYRRCILLSAFEREVIRAPHASGGGSFTGPLPVDLTLDGAADLYFCALDELPHHYQMHFLHAAEIVGYKHPDSAVRTWWAWFYAELVRDLHLFPESEDEMDRRLGDNESQWRARETGFVGSPEASL